ncbi:hypothetical protein BH24DEI1_BH24DEI1_11200 [soil metagenome]
MTAVWIYSTSRLHQAAIAELVSSLGYRAQQSRVGAELAIWDLAPESLPYPPPPELPTLALITAPDTTLVHLLRRGYRGHLSLDQDKLALEQALGALRGGEIWAERRILSRLLETRRDSHSVTCREQQVLDLLNLGLPNKKIAAGLGISESTVKVHISSLLAKHGAKRRTELILRHRRPALDLGAARQL